MKLKKIKVSGFKSFVDPTTLTIADQLVGVVGPNGCGKSNVIDAIRWVMGESSAKMLRGSSMTDVIFNGSAQRKPVGKASVELVFSNTEGKVPEPYAQFRELSIQRVLSRDGKSEYFVNHTRCRRKDIVDIFLGTGLGPRSYSVIEQGMVSRVIEARPDELRSFVEEAAGVSRYRERRRETENRIRHTRDNLERLEQRLDEITKVINRLQRQSRDAKRFNELRDEARAIETKLTAIQWRDKKSRLDNFDLEINELSVSMDAKVATLRGLDNKLESARETQAKDQVTFNDVQKLYYESNTLVTTLEERIRLSVEGAARLKRDLSEAHARLRTTEEEIADILDTQASSKIQLEELEPRIEEHEANIAEHEQARASLVEARSKWQNEWDAFQQKRHELERSIQIQRTKTSNLERQLELLAERKQKINNEYDELKQQAPHGVDGAILSLINELTGKIDGAEVALTTLEQTFETHEEQWNAAREKLAQKRIELGAIEARHDNAASVLARQQAGTNDQFEQSLGDLEIDVVARVIESVQSHSGHEGRTDELLAPILNAPVINADAENVSRLAQLDNAIGQWVLIDDGGGDHFAFSSTKFNPVAAVGEALESADLSTALGARHQLAATAYFITPEGHRVGPNWVKFAGMADSQGQRGVFATQAELDEHAKALEAVQREIAQLEADVDHKREARDASDEALKQQRSALNADRSQLAEQQQANVVNEERNQAAVRRVTQLEEEREEIAQNEARLRSEFEEAVAAGESAQAELEALLPTDEQLRSARDGHASKVDAIEAQLRERRTIAEQERLQRERLQSLLASFEQNLTRLTATREELSSRIKTWSEEHERASGADPTVESDLTKALAERRDHEAVVAQARAALEASQTTIDTLERERYQTDQAVNVARDQVQNQQINRQTLVVDVDALFERAQKDLPENVSLVEWIRQMGEELDDEDGLRERKADIEKRLERIGTVNLLAIEEFDQEKERLTYLEAQRDDLTEALATLESVIKKIDNDTRRLFSDTYNRLNDGFKTFFPRLFGGGSAHLELTDADELTAGVSVVAQPPGKRNSTIHLLSGGEKALTAVALMFALFELNPAPFCLLDEVDAPLDDANVERYCNTLQSIAQKTQLIFITHNKITMAIANTLMGVTMQEPGVSRIVTVSVDEAMKLAE